MKVIIRNAVESDKDIFISFALKLSQFNRNNHNSNSKYDDYGIVINSIQRKAQETFDRSNEDTLILIAELDGMPVGYALGRIIEEDETADNGTGRMGLLDELFVEDTARGFGLGQMLIDKIIKCMKELKINRIKLHAYSWNCTAKRLYEKNGFEEYALSYQLFI